MKQSGIARVAAILRRVVASVVGIAVALVVIEYGTRFVDAHAAASAASGKGARSEEPAVSINSLGFREREVGPKDPSRYRIAVVGDSYAWGQGLEARERFSDRLEAFLGPRYEVLNFGMRGHKMPEHLGELASVLTTGPDFVLLEMYINNFETPDMRRPSTYPLLPADWDGRLQDSSAVYRLLSDRWAQLQEATGIADSYERYMEKHLRDPNSPDARDSFGRLRRFFDTARAAGVASGAVLFPAADAMGPFGSDYPFGYLHDHVKAVCADARVPCLDLLALFSTLPDPHSTWVSPTDAHPNADINRRAAVEMLREFGPAWRR